VLELTAVHDGRQGLIIESQLVQGARPVATVLVQRERSSAAIVYGAAAVRARARDCWTNRHAIPSAVRRYGTKSQGACPTSGRGRQMIVLGDERKATRDRAVRRASSRHQLAANRCQARNISTTWTREGDKTLT